MIETKVIGFNLVRKKLITRYAYAKRLDSGKKQLMERPLLNII